MANLAVTKSGVLNIESFDVKSFFYTDTFLFKQLNASERTVNVFEFFFALTLLVLFSPIFLAVAVAIKLNMGGDVFYSQVRVGKDGKNFKIIKFRTMVADAEAKTGPVLATKDDPRVTKLGSFLRTSHVDELPQLFNVILGDMSFIGPRPERPEFVRVYNDTVNSYKRRNEVKPGITGLAQVCLPYDATPEQKIQYDVFYINNKSSVLLKVIISYYTALKMVTFANKIN